MTHYGYDIDINIRISDIIISISGYLQEKLISRFSIKCSVFARLNPLYLKQRSIKPMKYDFNLGNITLKVTQFTNIVLPDGPGRNYLQ